jgi:hypothetical protein
MSELPPPPVPIDADLRHFQSMPVDIDRLRRSKAWLICRRKPELAFFMFNLWGASWRGVPAGSLENDDDVLADAAMCSPERWPKIRADVMRGWQQFSDGRYYHRTVAEKVIESLNSTRLHRFNTSHARLRKDNVARKKGGLPLLPYPERPAELVLRWPNDLERTEGASGTFQTTFRSRGNSSEGKGSTLPREVLTGPALGNVQTSSLIAARAMALEGPHAHDAVPAIVVDLAAKKRVQQ